MIESKQGNLLEENAEALVNTVNCVGIMGKGIALQFKRAYRENFYEYEKACKANQVQPGKMFIFQTNSLFHPKYIINFPTKQHWKNPSKIEDIKSGLISLVAEVQRLSITSIAIPPLGCGNGGLDWNLVKPLIELAFAEVLTNLLEDKDNYVRLAAIQNYQENADKYLINSDNLLDNWQALQNPKISESQLVRLAKHKNAIIREAVALHPKTPVDIIAKLANDKHVAVRIGAAQNPNTPVDIIEKLAQTKTKKFQVARTAAIKVLVINYPEKANSYLYIYINTPIPSLSRLIGLLYVGASSDFLANNSDSPSYLERYAVAQHPNTPQDILSKLKNDPNRIVRAAAKAN
ncbi:hypothetical protein CAL7716_007340 [Calothrix sp. PCC 7716]|nr:hypothetical protein CAL7716_007340 [Calothrix sp. PCC 7716]